MAKNKASRLWADLSNNDPKWDAAEYAAAGHLLIGWKATEGSTFRDRFLKGAVRKAREHGVAVAFYHFAQPGSSSGVRQARHFWTVVKPLWQRGDYVVLDLEVPHPAGAVATRAWARDFQRELRRIAEHEAILYTGRSFLADFLGASVKRAFPRLWVAEYGPRLNAPAWARPVWAWQRTGDGIGRPPHSLPGCPAECDVNVLNVRTFRRLRRTRSTLKR